MPMTMLDEWIIFCSDLAAVNQKHSKPNTKTFHGLTWKIANFDKSMELTTVGYKEDSPKKMSQMKTHYFNEESFNLAVDEYNKICKKGRPGSTGISMRGHRTGDKRQDFCIQAITITLTSQKKTRVDIFYRNTELVKKFVADLIFFRDIIMPSFQQKEIDSINFYFSNAQMSSIFYPLLVAHQGPDWVGYLEQIELSDYYFYKNVLRWSYRYLNKGGDSYRFIKRIQDSLPRIFEKKHYEFFNREIRRQYNEIL